MGQEADARLLRGMAWLGAPIWGVTAIDPVMPALYPNQAHEPTPTIGKWTVNRPYWLEIPYISCYFFPPITNATALTAAVGWRQE